MTEALIGIIGVLVIALVLSIALAVHDAHEARTWKAYALANDDITFFAFMREHQGVNLDIPCYRHSMADAEVRGHYWRMTKGAVTVEADDPLLVWRRYLAMHQAEEAVREAVTAAAESVKELEA